MPIDSHSSELSRRRFLSKSIGMLGSMAIANAGIYAIGSAFKELDGSLVAGAKCNNYTRTYGSLAACSSGCPNYCSNQGNGCSMNVCDTQAAPVYYCECN